MNSGSLLRNLSTPLPSRIIDFSLYSNLFVASVTTACSYYYQSKAGLFIPEYLLFLFCSTLFIYNLEHNRLKEQDFINKPHRCDWLIANKRLITSLSLVSFIVYSTLFIKGANITRSFATLVMLVLSLVYCSDWFLKRLAIFKNILLAFIWSSACVLMPLFWHDSTLPASVYPAFAIFFLVSFINSLLCDHFDQNGDLKGGLESLAVRLNSNLFKILNIPLCLIVLGLSIYFNYYGFILTGCIYMFFVTKSKNSMNPAIYDFCLLLPLILL